jgi:putative membrane protein
MNQSQKAALIIGISVMAVLLFIVLGFIFFWGLRGGSFGFGMMGPGMMGGYGTMVFVPILFIVFLGLIVWAVVAAPPKTGVSNDADSKPDTPLGILKRRYAQGEIDKEEYETKKKDLT